jgi:hypothetical protein
MPSRRSKRIQAKKVLDAPIRFDFKKDLRQKGFARQLKKDIRRELSDTHEDWYGLEYPNEMLTISRNYYYPSEIDRFIIQQLGNSFGCHTCRTFISTDRNQPWTGDHIPPTQLRAGVRTWAEGQLGFNGGQQVLAPQCSGCSSRQAALVKSLNAMPLIQHAIDFLNDALHRDEKKLILGGKQFLVGTNCVQATGPKVTQTQGRRVQHLGERQGCHSCGTLYPASVYIADHIVPKEFCTTYMPQVFEVLGIHEIDWDELELRPQCPRCSTRQGGKISTISVRALQFARTVGITVYKY